VNPPLFQRVLGADFHALPPAVRALHGGCGSQVFAGVAAIERGPHWLVSLLAWATRLPPAAPRVPVELELVVERCGERWNRDFGGHRMPSRLFLREWWLGERLGAMEFEFELKVPGDEIHWRVRRAWLFGLVRLPSFLFSQVRCRERERGGRYEFLVEVAMPLIGPLIRYEGWLEPR
jgi:hypothetical protein